MLIVWAGASKQLSLREALVLAKKAFLHVKGLFLSTFDIHNLTDIIKKIFFPSSMSLGRGLMRLSHKIQSFWIIIMIIIIFIYTPKSGEQLQLKSYNVYTTIIIKIRLKYVKVYIYVYIHENTPIYAHINICENVNFKIP